MSLNSFLDNMYEQVKTLARHRRAETALCAVSFAESSFFPIPVDVMIIPMVQARPERWLRIAFLASLFSVIGGIAGYFLGMLFFETLAAPLLDLLGKTDSMAIFREKINAHSGLWVFGAGFTPFPYKVITIMSGAVPVNFGIFVTASVLSRSLRFFLVAGIVKKFGQKAEDIIKKNFALATIIIFAILAGLYAILHYAL
ncbi:YqaA family protein [Robiginitomaculum antarcticum]|uniref:YqaA family protein n=1 Tax=Robiginitomaculum antarcticum TaxID=437507 RepID=UPI000362AA95|nr:YqaA family protein [Robiginitomaculum antarcticum]